MKTCPRCYDMNPVTATACKQCGMALDSADPAVARTCAAAGHVMDPTWTVCAFCKAEGTVIEAQATKFETVIEAAPASRRTMFEFDAAPQAEWRTDPAVRTPSSPPAKPDRTRFDNGSAPAAQGPAPRGASSPTQTRRIVGVLVTYTWKPDGQIFPVREGRNWIGRDAQQADIAIPEDDTLSAVNSHITFRRSFVIGDNVSMGGTDVNGEPVEQQFHPLTNYACIRTGSTLWTFIAIEPTAG